MAIVKLISDLDGVWTNRETEAAYVWDYIVKNISGLTGFSADEVNKLMNDCRNDMDRSPYDYGWFNNGAIAAYYREDPFGDNNAIFDYINRAATTKTYSNFKLQLHTIKDSILTKAKMTLAEFSNHCFTKSTSQFKLEGKLKPVEAAGKIVKELNSKGVEIVVASNSSTEKIEHLFTKAGQAVTNEKSIVRGRLFARGGAQKFVIDKSYTDLPEYLETTGRYKLSLRRNNYHKILLEEKPDYVIGGVLSLDLAVPLYLRLNDKQFSGLKLILKVYKHTPSWVKEFLGKEEFKGFVYMIDSINGLSGILVGN